jgi:hypothetical protein
MAGFLRAHGYDPGPTQRPLLAGAIAGLAASVPAIALLWAFGALQVEARILGLSVAETLAAGWPIMALAGAIYSRLFGRAANDRNGSWLSGMAFGFVVWAGGAMLVLPIASGGMALAGAAAIGAFLSLVLWGAALGALLPIVHRPLQLSIESEARRAQSGPSAGLPAAR